MSMKRRLLLLILALVAPGLCRAATRNVGPGQTYPTIQAGINAATAGDTVLVYPGVYAENVDFLGKAITVISQAGPLVTIIDGKGTVNTGAVNFQSGEQRASVFSGFTVRNGGPQTSAGGSGGGVHVYQSAPTITNNILTGNACNNILVNLGAPLLQFNFIYGAVTPASGYCQFPGAGVLLNGTRTVGAYAHAEISGNSIHDNSGTFGGGVVLNAAEGTLLQSNFIVDNSGLSAGGLYMVNTVSVSVVGNVFYGNTMRSGSGGPSTPSGLYLAPPYSTVGPVLGLVEGNTITDALSLTGNLAQYLVIDNILAGASATPVLQCAYTGPLAITPPAFDHNDVYNSGGPAYGTGCPDQTGTFGNISADPRFTAAGTGNYQLLAGSPAIDAGNNSAPTVASSAFPQPVDIIQTPRIQNGSGKSYAVVDMGAFEFSGTPDTGHTNIALTPSEYFASANPSPIPPPLSLTVTLTSAAGQPYGYTAIYEDGTLLATVNVGPSGTATITPSNLTAGTHSFTAVYPAPQTGTINGPFYLTPAVSPQFFLLVPKSQSSLTLTSSPNPSAYGAPVTFSVTASAGVTPISLIDTTTNTPLTTLQGSGTYATSSLTPGNHTITASFPGSSTVAPVSASVVQSVNPIVSNATLSVTGAKNGQYYAGAPILLTAVVTSTPTLPAGPTGTVVFYLDGNALGILPLSGGSATLSTIAPAAGTHTLFCVYSGDASYSSSVCGTITINVAMPPTQAIVFPQPAASAYAATSVALTAVASSGLPVTYTVVSGPATVSGSTLTYLGAGSVVIQADQPGDTTFPPAAPVRDTVNVALLTEPLTASTGPIPTLITFLTAGTLANISVTAQGATGLDFNLAAGGTCTLGTVYTAGQTCIANFTFAPQHPGLRYGGIALSTGNGTLLANSYLLGLGTGPQVLYNPANQTSFGTGFVGLSGIAVDGYGNIYASDYNGAGIYEINIATNVTRLLASALQATDIAVDGSGNVFYTTRGDVAEILAVNGVIPATPTVRTLATGFIAINGMKVDANGNVFLATSSGGGTNSAITELFAVNGSIPASPAQRVLVANVGTPTGVAIDLVGNVYFSDQTGHSVHELVAVDGVIPATPVQRIVSTAFVAPTNCFFDVSGNLYVPDGYAPDVKELLAVNLVLPANPTIISLGAGLGIPSGGTVDSGGSLYIADINIPSVVKLAYGSAPTLTFANTLLNHTSADSPQTITITNGGNADLIISPPLTGTNAKISPAGPYPAPASFSIGAGSTCPLLNPGDAPATLPAGASCTTQVSFTPLTRRNTAALVRTDNNLSVPGSIQVDNLSGAGIPLPPGITFTVPNHTFGDPPFTVQATSISPGTFTYSVVSGPATIAGNVVTLTGAGTVTLLATQAASGIYDTGTASATFNVAKKPQTITFPQPATPVPFNTSFPLSATASSGLPITYTVVSGSARIAGNVVTPTAAGTLVIAADQPGDTNYAAAPQVTRTITVNFGAAVITLTGAPTPVFLSNPVTFSSTVTGAGGTATGSVQFREGASVVGSAPIVNGSAVFTTTTLAVGTHVIVAYYSGDLNFAPAVSSSVTIVVQDFRLTITNPDLSIKHGGVAVYNLVVTSIGGAGLASTIDLTFTGGPDHSISTLTPTSIATGSGSTNATLTMQTPNYPTGPFMLAGLFALLLLPVKRARRWLALVFVVLFLGAATGCGSGWKAQKWDVTVTARSGALVRTASATLVSAP